MFNYIACVFLNCLYMILILKPIKSKPEPLVGKPAVVGIAV